MGMNHKKLSDRELIKLYREKGDLTAYAVLHNKYRAYSIIVANDIIKEYRPNIRPDFEELVQIGIFSFVVAVKKFDFSKTYFRPFWKKIATNAMYKELYDEVEKHHYIVNKQMAVERETYETRGQYFSSGASYDHKGDLLMAEIKKYLSSPKNRISKIEQDMFLDYLENPSYSEIAEKYHLSSKTTRKKIDNIRQRIIDNILR